MYSYFFARSCVSALWWSSPGWTPPFSCEAGNCGTCMARLTEGTATLREWYLSVLDAWVVFENDFLCFMTFDDEHHRLALAQLPAPVPRTAATVGLAHSAYTFADLEALLVKREQLAARGIQSHVPVQHGPTTSIYYRDPDLNTVELQIDNFAAPDDATTCMQGPEYTADPFGPSFDPDAMLMALRAGTPVAELCTHAWALKYPQVNVPMLLLS